MAKKPDGVIVAVHYAPDGKIETVRIFEQRGQTYTDRVHVTRSLLVERLKSKKHYVVGKRKSYLGSTFETGPVVQYLDSDVVTTRADAKADTLEGVPVY
jgi:hypothetical protein